MCITKRINKEAITSIEHRTTSPFTRDRITPDWIQMTTPAYMPHFYHVSQSRTRPYIGEKMNRWSDVSSPDFDTKDVIRLSIDINDMRTLINNCKKLPRTNWENGSRSMKDALASVH